MKIYNEKSIVEINLDKAKEEAKDATVQSLASELAKTKIKLMQSESINKNLTDEMVKVKLDIMQLKGGNQ